MGHSPFAWEKQRSPSAPEKERRDLQFEDFHREILAAEPQINDERWQIGSREIRGCGEKPTRVGWSSIWRRSVVLVILEFVLWSGADHGLEGWEARLGEP